MGIRKPRLLVLGLLVAGVAVLGNGWPALAQDAHATCGLDTPAFCETFAVASKSGGRTGPLDPRRWSVARVSGIDNPSQGMVDEFPSTALVSCKDPPQAVLPDDDFVLCNDHGADSTHLAEALNDGGSYVYKAARIRQPFDFADRTGTIAFDVNAQTDGEHSYWIEVWVTDEPSPGPHADSSGSASLPRNGLGLKFSQNCGRPDTSGGLHYLSVVRDFMSHTNIVDRAGFPRISTNGCYATDDYQRNHFEVRLSQDRVEVWASDAGGANFRLIGWSEGLDLPFSRGYISFEHVHYNAAKFGSEAEHTFQWANIGFDGPRLATPGGYDVPDARLSGRDPGSLNLGYVIGESGARACCTNGKWQDSPPFVLAGVALDGASQATLNLSLLWHEREPTIQYRLNGQDWHAVPVTLPQSHGYSWRAVSIPVALDELSTGDNTLELASADQVSVANIDLTVDR